MQATTLEGLFLQPGFISIFLAILVTIANILIGVSILPDDKREKGYRLHRNVFFVILVCYLMFLVITHQDEGNRGLNYFVLFYISIIIPLSRRANVKAHAILASIGLVLLTLVATLYIGGG
ncbi:MAG: hypothetical protein ACE5E9_05850 [Nitrospinaceae bacterium]